MRIMEVLAVQADFRRWGRFLEILIIAFALLSPAVASRALAIEVSPTGDAASGSQGGEIPGASAEAEADPCESVLTGELSAEWIAERHAESEARPLPFRRLSHVTRLAGGRNVMLNWDLIEQHDPHYTHELPTAKHVTHQAQSGRCWIFAGLNQLRTQLMSERKVNDPQFEFSQAYLHFFNMLEKSNMYLETVIRRHGEPMEPGRLRELLMVEDHIGDGGWWSYFQFLVAKYGLVPKRAMAESMGTLMSGLVSAELELHLAASAAEMLSTANRLAAEGATNAEKTVELRKFKERMMRGVWRILVTHLGEPPTEFTYRVAGEKTIAASRVLDDGTANMPTEDDMEGAKLWKHTPTKLVQLTPQEFATDFVGFDPNDYVVVSANPLRPENEVYRVEYSAIGKAAPGEQAFHRKVLNTDTEMLETLVYNSILAGEPVWFAMSMGSDVDDHTGIMHPAIFDRRGLYDFREGEVPQPLDIAQAQYLGQQGPNHAMLFVGMDIPFEEPGMAPIKLKVENSWGKGAGTKGYYHMYRAWFHRYVSEIVVHRKHLTEEARRMWDHSQPVKIGEDEYYYAPGLTPN